MTENALPTRGPSAPARLPLRRLRRSVLRRLQHIQSGHLVVIDPAGRHEFGEHSDTATLSACLQVDDVAAFAEIALGGSIGAAESFMRGEWRCERLTDLVRILLANRDVLDGLDQRWLTALRRGALRIWHRARRNTRRGAQRNIAAHYDLGNELFELFLDPMLMYSSAVYPRPDAGLDEAARYKVDLICRKLDLDRRDHLLEIGTGWGGLAIHAAKRYGCRVTTTTLSREQYRAAKARIAAAGVDDRVELLLRDYRDLEGRYDKLVSVEMIEAVGYERYEEYFGLCERLLKPGGRMLLQAITIADQVYERARDEVDFIKRYIFPGGCLPSNTAITNAVTRATTMQLVDLHDIGADYARTLAHWRERFCARLDAVRALGYDERFIRMWRYYLCYCEGAFLERATSAAQFVLARPGAVAPRGWSHR